MTISRARGRPRHPEVDNKILAAASDLLARQGYDAMTFEAISQATGITRPTIYRRWPTRAHLANDIANGGNEPLPDLIDNHSLRQQVHALAGQIYRQFRRPGAAAASIGLITAYQNNGDLRSELNSPLEEATREQLRAIVIRGQDAGKIDPGVDADVLFDALVGAVLFRIIISSRPVDDDFVDHLTNLLCTGLTARNDAPQRRPVQDGA